MKAAIARLFSQVGGVKRVEVRLPHVRKTQLYGYTDPGDDAEIRFADVAALTQQNCDAAAEFLAHLAGGVFLPLPAGGDDEVSRLTGQVARESGEAIAALLDAMSDGKITPAEARRVLGEIDDLMRVLAHLRGQVASRLQDEVGA
ncbi:phage regulatory CII family protein [Vineibacter terrae]|uniref:phage regulatory CII family protein n=1 Tax=Vineibacter terrae TaxID=2586908 RepID=UPI002E2EA6D6|nr:phage regulatory CII family protein [Vineibacter terrae]HEX2892277.1 phage regulatory CII family protein [Vineibacter terrae]